MCCILDGFRCFEFLYGDEVWRVVPYVERDHIKGFADQMSGRNKVARRKGKGGGGDEVSIEQ